MRLKHIFIAAALMASCKQAPPRLVFEGAADPDYAYNLREAQRWPVRKQNATKDSAATLAYATAVTHIRENLGADPTLNDKIICVNSYVNMFIGYVPDSVIYGERDYFASAAQTFKIRRGDCEDFALAKYELLQELGVERERLMVLLVADGTTEKKQLNHCVLAVDTTAANDWRGAAVLNAGWSGSLKTVDELGYTPYFGFNDKKFVKARLKVKP